MPQNDFLPFGTAGTAPVLSNAAYAGITPANGFSAGLLPKENINKALRQSSVMASMLGSFINAGTHDALDNGDLVTLLNNFIASVKSYTKVFTTTYYSFVYPEGGTLLLPPNTFGISVLGVASGAYSQGARTAVQIRDISNTVIATVPLGGTNEYNGNDGGSGMEDSSACFVPMSSNAYGVTFIRVAGSGTGAISFVLSAITTFA